MNAVAPSKRRAKEHGEGTRYFPPCDKLVVMSKLHFCEDI
jgi:hypothetical protein